MSYSNVTGLNSNDLKLFLLLCENFSTYLKFNVACQRLVLTHDDLQNVFKNIASSIFSDSLKTFKFHQNYPISTRPNRYIILEIVSNTPESDIIFRPRNVGCDYTFGPKGCRCRPREEMSSLLKSRNYSCEQFRAFYEKHNGYKEDETLSNFCRTPCHKVSKSYYKVD